MTGSGIILKIFDIPPERIEMHGCDKLYHFVTDFGNFVVLTEGELISNYEFSHIEEDIVGRFKRQQDLLKQVYADYL